MFNFYRVALSSLGAVLLTTSCTISMSDDKIFQPPRWTDVAELESELRFENEDQLLSENSALKENALLASHLPAIVEHGFLPAANEKIAYSIIRSPKSKVDDERPLILSCYGSGGDRPNWGVYYTEKLLPWGDVLQFDYPGYGDSSGNASIKAVTSIAPSVVELANKLAGERPLVFWGHSLGGFLCPYMAQSSPKFDGFVYETTALNEEEAAEEWKPWFLRILPFIKMEPDTEQREGDNATPLAGLSAPVLVLGGGKDKVLPAWLSRSLAAALKEQGNDVLYLEFENGTHTDVPLQPDFAERADPFFMKVRERSGHSN